MVDEKSQHGVGGVIGTEAADHVDRHSAIYCASERQRIETVNRPAILASQARILQLREQERDIQQRLYHAPPPGVARLRKLRTLFRYAVAIFLTAAAFIFSVLAFDPYRLGWKSWVYCLGISIVTPFLVDRILERWASQRLVNMVATAAGIAAIVSLILLGVIRGEIMAQQVLSTPSAVVDGSDDAGAATVPHNTFYNRTFGLLQLVMAFLAFSIEIGAGIALHEAGQLHAATDEDSLALRRELTAIQERMIAHGHEVWALENAGAAFEQEFRRDFHRSLLNGVKGGTGQTLLLIMFLSIGVIAHAQVPREQGLDLVVLVDLSKSVAVRGHDSKEQFQDNLRSVTAILGTVPGGTKIRVVGITDNSFATPYIIFSGELGDDEGYFKERLAEGRGALARAWALRAAKLSACYHETDILGAVLVASEMFREEPRSRRRVLVVLSDMRQATGALDLERQPLVKAETSLQQATNNKLIADLSGVDVYAEGVDGAGESVAYWQSLQDFWRAYFARAGATVKRYSPLRDLPEVVHVISRSVESREQ